MKYYSLKKINSKNAVYNIIFGERSNGKTYACLKQALDNYFNNGSQFVYLRRWTVDIQPKRMVNLFNALVENDYIRKISNDKFTNVYYRTGTFYLCHYDDSGKPIYNDDDILGYAFSLSDTEHDKSSSYPKVSTIVFDEFLTNHIYLNDEFILFMNTVSTIVRLRTDVKIYMLGNTVNKYCPYFKEMGLDNILTMNKDTIDIYKYGESNLTVAVEYAGSTKRLKANNFYFAFKNPKLKMITGGDWELNIYPHAPIKWKSKDIQFIYFIDFNDQLFQCEIILKDNNFFTYIHEKTTPLQNNKTDIIYSLEHKPDLRYNINILKPYNEVGKRISWFFIHNKVYYQNNDVGESINNFLKESSRK